jgi:hypothetical protein
MATTVLTILNRFKFSVNDAGLTRWTDTEFKEWLNAGQIAIVQLNPVAFTENVSLTLVSGPKQTLGATGMLLANVVRNGDGKAITEIRKGALDVANPDWMSSAPKFLITHYAKDAREKRVFYVYPPSDGAGTVELLQAKYPTIVTDTAADSISLPDEYADALLDYVLYRAYSKDVDYSGPAGLAQTHYDKFVVGVAGGQQASQGQPQGNA